MSKAAAKKNHEEKEGQWECVCGYVAKVPQLKNKIKRHLNRKTGSHKERLTSESSFNVHKKTPTRTDESTSSSGVSSDEVEPQKDIVSKNDENNDEWAHGGECQGFPCFFCQIMFFTKDDQVSHLDQCRKEMPDHVEQAASYFDLNNYICDIKIQAVLETGVEKQQFILQLKNQIEQWAAFEKSCSNIETNLKLFEQGIELIDDTVGQIAVVFMRALLGIFDSKLHSDAIQSLKSFFKTIFIEKDNPHTLFQQLVLDVGQNVPILEKLFSMLEDIDAAVLEDSEGSLTIHSEKIPIHDLKRISAWLKKQIPVENV